MIACLAYFLLKTRGSFQIMLTNSCFNLTHAHTFPDRTTVQKAAAIRYVYRFDI